MNAALSLHDVESVTVQTHKFNDKNGKHDFSTTRLLITDASGETFTLSLFLVRGLTKLNIDFAKEIVVHD